MTSRPNILIVMVDQLTGTLFEDGPADFLHAPNLRRLAEHSVRFANAYTASPLCAPARASFMTGCLPRRTGVYDITVRTQTGKAVALFRGKSYRIQGEVIAGLEQAAQHQ